MQLVFCKIAQKNHINFLPLYKFFLLLYKKHTFFLSDTLLFGFDFYCVDI